MTVSRDGENISDGEKVIISVYDGDEQNSIVLNESEIFAKDKNAVVRIPSKLASGKYGIKITLSDENVCYESYSAGEVIIVNSKTPGAAANVEMKNFGDDKLKITVDTVEENFDGYMVEVYEDEKLADTGLYFKRDEEIIVGEMYINSRTDKGGR